MEKQHKGNLRKGESLNKLQKNVFFYQFRCQPCLSCLLLGASIVMGIQSVLHARELTHAHLSATFMNLAVNTVDDSLEGHCANVVGSRPDYRDNKICRQRHEIFNAMLLRNACVL